MSRSLTGYFGTPASLGVGVCVCRGSKRTLAPSPFPWAIPAVGPHVGGMPDLGLAFHHGQCVRQVDNGQLLRRRDAGWGPGWRTAWPELHSIP